MLAPRLYLYAQHYQPPSEQRLPPAGRTGRCAPPVPVQRPLHHLNPLHQHPFAIRAVSPTALLAGRYRHASAACFPPIANITNCSVTSGRSLPVVPAGVRPLLLSSAHLSTVLLCPMPARQQIKKSCGAPGRSLPACSALDSSSTTPLPVLIFPWYPRLPTTSMLASFAPHRNTMLVATRCLLRYGPYMRFNRATSVSLLLYATLVYFCVTEDRPAFLLGPLFPVAPRCDTVITLLSQ